eukprot:jgi/Hompol1/4104/HPOL_001725-RA
MSSSSTGTSSASESPLVEDHISPSTVMDDDPRPSRLRLHPCFEFRLPSPGLIDTCFVAHNSNDERVLMLGSQEKQYACAVQIDRGHGGLTEGSLVGEWNAVQIMPIESSRRGFTDALIRTTQHSFYVWTGTASLLQCILPSDLNKYLGLHDSDEGTFKRSRSEFELDVAVEGDTDGQSISTLTSSNASSDYLKRLRLSPTKSRRQHRSSSISTASRPNPDIVILRTFGSNAVFKLPHGTEIIANLAFYAHSSLVSSVLRAVESVVPDQLFVQLHHRFISYCHPASGSPTRRSAELDAAEWDSFVIALFGCLKPPDPDSTQPQSSRSGEINAQLKDDSDSDWQWFLKNKSQLAAHCALPLIVLSSLPKRTSLTEPQPLNSPASERLKRLFHKARREMAGASSPRSNLTIDSHLDKIVLVLHAVFEDLKLSTVFRTKSNDLGSLLMLLSQTLGWNDYVDHYLRDGITTAEFLLPGIGTQPELEIPMDIYRWLRNRIEHHDQDRIGLLRHMEFAKYSLLKKACPKIHLVQSLYNAIYSPKSTMVTGLNAQPSPLLRCMSILNVSLSDLDTLPVGVALPIREALHAYRSEVMVLDHLDLHQLAVLGRNDLIAQRVRSKAFVQKTLPEFSESNVRATDFATIHRAITTNSSVDLPFDRQTDDDYDVVFKLRFGCNETRAIKIADVMDLFDASQPADLVLTVPNDLSDLEFAKEQQVMLHYLAQRTWGLFVGLGILLAHTTLIVPTERVNFPDVTVKAKFVPERKVVVLNNPPQQSASASPVAWAEFHAGVAVGLQIRSSSSLIDNTWLVFNWRNQDVQSEQVPPPQHDLNDSKYAGFIVGLGLNGNFAQIDFRTLLTSHFDHRKPILLMSMLLGMGTSAIATCDFKIVKTLMLHMTRSMERDHVVVTIPWIAQAAAMASFGLVYMGSRSRTQIDHVIAELTQIEWDPLDESNASQECYATSCGFALGCIALHIDTPQQQQQQQSQQRQNTTRMTSDTLHAISTPLIKLLSGSTSTLVAQGACLALALAFLKTNNKALCDRIVIPSTLYLMDSVRPDLLTLRVVARNLIMWDSIVPTWEWMTECLPKFMAGLGIRDQNRHRDDSREHDNETRCRESIRWQAYAYLMAGACLSLALKFVGTGDQNACACLKLFLNQCLEKIAAQNDVMDYDAMMLKHAFRSALNVVCTSLGIVMAGTGDLELFTLFKSIHDKISAEITFGNHMATGMAIGFLFLGKGVAALGNSNRAIAVLLMSLFPTYPSSPSDNRAHLQALRHLWATAIEESRCVITRDVDTQTPVIVPIHVTLGPDAAALIDRTLAVSGSAAVQGVYKLMTPCILPPLAYVEHIQVQGPRYWPVRINVADTPPNHRKSLVECIWVKRKIGYLPYLNDPMGHNMS